MSNTSYTNLPPTVSKNSDYKTITAFNTFYDTPIEIETTVYDACKGFFTSKGFDIVSAESVALIIIQQAKKDKLNSMQILDSLKGLSDVEISALVAEIINYNRFKTSFLGYALDYRTNEEVARNIMA